jgi:hypothetical protein
MKVEVNDRLEDYEGLYIPKSKSIGKYIKLLKLHRFKGECFALAEVYNASEKYSDLELLSFSYVWRNYKKVPKREIKLNSILKELGDEINRLESNSDTL